MILSLQLYSLRAFMPFEEMLAFCQKKGLRYVEPAGLYGLRPSEMVSCLKKYGLKAPSFHFSLEFLQEHWAELGQQLPECGTQDLVMPFADSNSLDEVRRLAASLQAIAEKLKGLGLRLHYHNHSHEITRVFAGKCLIDCLLELAPELYWQLDVGWVTAGGGVVSAKMRQWAQRVSMLHIKDILAKDGSGPLQTRNEGGVEVLVRQKGGQPERMGDGIVDFASIFAAARELGISTFILENDDPEDAAAFADSGIALVQKYMGS